MRFMKERPGFQAMDLLGRKILRDGTAFQLLQEAVLSCAREAENDKKLENYSSALSEAWQNCMSPRRRSADATRHGCLTMRHRSFARSVMSLLRGCGLTKR